MGSGSGDKQQVHGDTETRTDAWRDRVKRDNDQDVQDQHMDIGNQDTDTGPLGLGEDWEERGHRGPGPGCERVRIQKTRRVTWEYCDQDGGVQDTDTGAGMQEN